MGSSYSRSLFSRSAASSPRSPATRSSFSPITVDEPQFATPTYEPTVAADKLGIGNPDGGRVHSAVVGAGPDSAEPVVSGLGHSGKRISTGAIVPQARSNVPVLAQAEENGKSFDVGIGGVRAERTIPAPVQTERFVDLVGEGLALINDGMRGDTEMSTVTTTCTITENKEEKMSDERADNMLVPILPSSRVRLNDGDVDGVETAVAEREEPGIEHQDMDLKAEPMPLFLGPDWKDVADLVPCQNCDLQTHRARDCTLMLDKHGGEGAARNVLLRKVLGPEGEIWPLPSDLICCHCSGRGHNLTDCHIPHLPLLTEEEKEKAAAGAAANEKGYRDLRKKPETVPPHLQLGTYIRPTGGARRRVAPILHMFEDEGIHTLPSLKTLFGPDTTPGSGSNKRRAGPMKLGLKKVIDELRTTHPFAGRKGAGRRDGQSG